MTTYTGRNEEARTDMKRLTGDAAMGGFLLTLRIIFLWFASLFSTSVEVLYRRSFGERYLGVLTLLGSIGLFIWGMVFFGGRFTFLSGVFLAAFAVAGFTHLGFITWRNWKGMEWHTRAAGDSWLAPFFHRLRYRLPFRVPFPSLTQRIIEPLLTAAVGLLMPDPLLRYWFLAAALSLYVREMLTFQDIRNAYLDMQDQKIESQAFKELFKTGWGEFAGGVEPGLTVTKSHEGFVARIPGNAKTSAQFVDNIRLLEKRYPEEAREARTELETENKAAAEWAQLKAARKAEAEVESSPAADD